MQADDKIPFAEANDRSSFDQGLAFVQRAVRAMLFTYRGWLVIAAIAVCIYSVGVLVYVRSAPDLGLRTAFGVRLKAPASLRTFKPDEPDGPIPQTGDRVLELGNLKIETWADLVSAPRKLSDRANGASDSGLSSIGVQRDPSDPNATWVRARFAHDTESGQTQIVKGWCLLDSLALEDILPTLLWFFLKLALFVIGALVFWKRPTEATASQFFLLCIVTLGAYMGGYHWTHIAGQPPLVLGFMICGVMLPVVSLHFYLVFPRHKETLAKHPGYVLAAVYGPPLVFLLAIVGLYFRSRVLYLGDAGAEAIRNALEDLRIVTYVYLGVAALWYVFSIAALIHSFRTVKDLTEHNQVKWILVGASIALLPIGYSLYLAMWRPDDFGAGAATWPMFAASVCLTAAFTVSITRYRLMELDKLVSSGVSYFFISFLAGLVHYAVALLVTLVFYQQFFDGPSFPETLAVGLTVLVLMLVLDFFRGRLRRSLDRRLFRDKSQLEATLQRMGHTVGQMVDPPTVAQRLLQATTELLGVTRGGVYLRHGDDVVYSLAAHVGPRPMCTQIAADEPLIDTLRGQSAVTSWTERRINPSPGQRHLQRLGFELAHALSHEGRLLAVLTLGPKDGSAFQRDDLNLVAALAQVTVLALNGALGHQTIETLSRDLQEKIEKISEQQRRILSLRSQLRRVGVRRIIPAVRDFEPFPANGQNTNGLGSPTAASERESARPPEAVVPIGGIVGSSPHLRQVLQLIGKVAANDTTVVLIRGESGTGKGLLAQAIHDSSPRAGKPFVKVHCAALSPTLLESELFGHVKGAFTGAHRDKIGRFELADRGTLFLDEIGDISLEVQTKLLRVLQERTFERVGSSEPVTVDVRILTATHQDLEELIRQGRFREDLYYRLNVFPVFVPPLRERWQDIPELALHFLRQAADRCKKSVLHIDDDALAVLKSYPWRGNVRQLENVMERAVVIAEDEALHVSDLPDDVVRHVDPESMMPEAATFGESVRLTKNGSGNDREGKARSEHEAMVRALAEAGGNKAEAARLLGLARSTLLSRLKKLGLS